MKKLRQSEIWALLALAALPLGLMGANCQGEDQLLNQKTGCEAGTAQITVWDGFLQRNCGCGGTDGEFITRPAPLNCTLSLGTAVFIHFQGPLMTHQIIAVGTPAIPESPIYDPSSHVKIYTHAFTPTEAGTYSFKDLFNDDFTGSFIVTP